MTPTKPGLYWYRWEKNAKAEVVEVTFNDYRKQLQVWVIGKEYSSPLSEHDGEWLGEAVPPV